MKNFLIITSVCALGGLLFLVLPSFDKPSVAKTAQQQFVTLSNLPEHIRPLLGEYQYELVWSVARKITPADKDLLLKLYRQEPSLVKKRSLTTVLGFIGDEEVVEVFKHTLSDQYAGKKLSTGKGDNQTNEELVMHKTVAALGFLANKSDSAYDLIKKGVDPSFWKDYCKFTPATGPDFYGTLSGAAIKAIGRSGRTDVTNILEGFKTQPLVNSLDASSLRMSFEGAVFDAAFANDIILQRGMDYYKRLFLDIDTRLQVMTEWEKQGNGLEWDKWYQKKKME